MSSVGRAHEGQGGVRDVLMGHAFQQRPRLRPRDREADHVVGNVAHRDALAGVIGEPAHVPAAQIVGALDPEGPVAPVDQGEVALEPAALGQHRRKPRAAGLRHGAGHQPGEPGFGFGSGHLVAGEGGDIEQTDAFAHQPAFGADDGKRVRALERRLLLEAGRREIERDFEPPANCPIGSRPRSSHHRPASS